MPELTVDIPDDVAAALRLPPDTAEAEVRKELAVTLDAEDADALALADQIEASLVLLDESAARQRAKSLGLRKTGTVGLLLRAKREGSSDRIRRELDELRATSFWIDEALYRRVLEAVDESPDEEAA
jgi:predicted nucleic acid-binding protein